MADRRPDGDQRARGNEDVPVELDGVAPPEHRGPTLVVWRRYGRRRDQVRGAIRWAALLVLAGSIMLLALHGSRPRTGDVVTIGAVVAAFWLIALFFNLTSKGYLAAGEDWLMSSRGRWKTFSWVRTDHLTNLELGGRRPTLRLTDAEHHEASIEIEDLRSSEPLRRALDDALTSSRRLPVAPEIVPVLRAPVERGRGRTVVRSHGGSNHRSH